MKIEEIKEWAGWGKTAVLAIVFVVGLVVKLQMRVSDLVTSASDTDSRVDQLEHKVIAMEKDIEWIERGYLRVRRP